jgi:hypothetical protein
MDYRHGVLQPLLKQNLVPTFKRRKVLKGHRTIARSLTTVAQISDGEIRENLHSLMSLLLLYGCSIRSYKTWSSSALWHDSFDPRSWLNAQDVSNLTQVVPPPVIPHPRVPSSTSSAATRGRCRGLLPMTMVTLAYMPRFHTSKNREWSNVTRWQLLFHSKSFTPFIGETFRYTWSPITNCNGRRLLFG